MITRWIVALGLVGLTGWGLLEFKRATTYFALLETEDEILAYEVTPSRGASFELAAGLERVLVSAYGVLPAEVANERGASPAPDDSVTFGVLATLTDGNGKPCDARSYEAVSRVELGQESGAHPAARLAYSPDRVTDPRTLTVDVRSCAEYGGRLELRATHGEVTRVLLRVSQIEARAPLEQELVSRRLGPEERAAIVEARASLGFADLPVEVQQRAVAGWRRRIAAVGQRDVDYVQRRLILQKVRPPSVEVVDPQLGMDVGPGRSLALNVRGAPRLEVESRAGQIVRVTDGAETQSVRTPETGRVTVQLAEGGARTVSLAATTPTRLRVFVEPAARELFLGEHELTTIDGRVHVGPDMRRHRLLRLDPEQPVVLRVPPGQSFFGLTVRARLLDSPSLDGALPLPAFIEGSVRARWSQGSVAETRVRLEPSQFDYFGDDHFASERATLQLRVPPGAERLELFGDPVLSVLPWTEEPGVTDAELTLPYRSALVELAGATHPTPGSDGLARVSAAPSIGADAASTLRWRHADHEQRPWAPLWPENGEALQVAGRVLELLTQARLEGTEPRLSEARPERALVPELAVLRRQLITERPAGSAETEGAWSWLAAGRGSVQVPAEGAGAGLLEVLYRAEETALGGTLGLLVDGVPAAEETLVLASGKLRVPVAPGAHGVELRSPRGDLLAFAKAPPAAGGRALRAHTTFALTPSRTLTFAVDKTEAEPLLLVLIVATEGKQPFALSYAVDGGRAARRAGEFYRRTTEDAGIFEAVGGQDGRALLWEAERPPNSAAQFPDGLAKLRIPLGDDLSRGVHRVTLRLLSRGGARVAQRGGAVDVSGTTPEETVWVRAVLVGSDKVPVEDDTRWWASEVEP
jgi:hypothetical protein